MTNYSKQANFVKYFHLSLEFVKLILIVPTFGISLVTGGISELNIALDVYWNEEIGDGFYTFYLSLSILGFFVPAVIRRVTGFPLWRRILSRILLVSSLIIVITTYRFALFIATFYTL